MIHETCLHFRIYHLWILSYGYISRFRQFNYLFYVQVGIFSNIYDWYKWDKRDLCALIKYCRQMKTYSEVNKMSWRVRPDDILLEVGRLFGSKMGLQKLNVEVVRYKIILFLNVVHSKAVIHCRIFHCNKLVSVQVEHLLLAVLHHHRLKFLQRLVYSRVNALPLRRWHRRK